MRNAMFLLAIALLAFSTTYSQEITEGSLFAAARNGTELGACPLKDTKVSASVSGFVARVNVRQEFQNTFTEPIEAVYVFPLSQNGAVDSMTMTIGTRVVRATIMKREEARTVYEGAKQAGQTAALLDQERPNIFTQAVANIMPGESVIIDISYVETLKYEDGQYEFVFPMTVGPRYNPASVTDAAKVRPPYALTRAGHDISIEVNLNAGVPVESIRSSSHAISQVNVSPAVATITLANEKTVPNKDFVLRYDVSGKRIADAVLSHRGDRGGFFTMILQPPDIPVAEERTPKEIVFVLDTSGSMSGFPIEKAKEAMKLSLDGLYPEDMFNVITFAGDTRILFPAPVTATQANLDKAQDFLNEQEGAGGTEMMAAIKASLAPSASSAHLRIVCFMTDGYVGNEDEIVAEIQRHPNARVFSFGIGSSVNRFLLDKMAEAGRGEVEYVSLVDDGSKAARKFYDRVRTPLMTDISIDWNGLPVSDVSPSKLGDLFSAKPVVVTGRYSVKAAGTIKLKGKIAGQEYTREIAVNLPESEPANDVLGSIWARRRIDQLSSEASTTANLDELNDRITDLGLEFRLLTKFTSFVAVEETVRNTNGSPVRVDVPVEVPEGVDPNTTVAKYRGWNRNDIGYIVTTEEESGTTGSGVGTGVGYGYGSGTGSGSGGGMGSVNATVDVTSSESSVVKVETSDASKAAKEYSVDTSITRRVVEQLPAGTTFSSLLKTSPAARPEALSGSFMIDGASGAENTFVIDGSEVTNFRTGAVKASSYDPIEGSAQAIAEPVYPTEAAAKKILGKVTVEITVDRFGVIQTAEAVSGPKALRDAARAAAMLSKLSPAMIDSKPVRLKGRFIYHFVSPDEVKVSVNRMAALPLTEADHAELRRASKLHGSLFRLMTGQPGPNDLLAVSGRRVAVTVILDRPAVEALKKLGRTGFKAEGEPGADRIAGSISIDSLGALADLGSVKLVVPRF